jgi:hypothetical protein
MQVYNVGIPGGRFGPPQPAINTTQNSNREIIGTLFIVGDIGKGVKVR